MEQIIKNMNFKPMLEDVEYQRLEVPKQNATVNMRTWDEIKVERLRSDAVKVYLERSIEPDPKSLFSLSVRFSMEVLVFTAAYENLDDPEEFFKKSQVMQVLCSHVATVIAQLTTHGPIGPMITAPVPIWPK